MHARPHVGASPIKSFIQEGVPTGEKLWRMPMEDSYLEHLESPIADLKNTGIQHRFGGAITASLFLKEFVKTDTVRMHPLGWPAASFRQHAWQTCLQLAKLVQHRTYELCQQNMRQNSLSAGGASQWQIPLTPPGRNVCMQRTRLKPHLLGLLTAYAGHIAALCNCRAWNMVVPWQQT